MPKSQQLFRLIAGLTLLVLQSISHAQSSAQFPRPPELEPAIKFWTRVYTEVDTQSGFLHDSQNLAIVYRSLPLDNEVIEANRSQIQQDLRLLGSGKRSQLTTTQSEILALWPANVGNDTLTEAANNVRWQLGQSDRFLDGLIRSGAYRAHINQVIRERNLPIELSVLPHVESSFNPSAYSSAAAAGMWQFTPDTGKRFMRIDHIVDERMDPYISAGAAMSLLEYNYSVLGTWPLALTAYNHGAGGISRARREMGTDRIEVIIANYKGRAFGFASRNFYPQFLAVRDVENNARRYFGDVRLAAAPDFIAITTDAYIDAEVFARSVGINFAQFRADNPALRPVVWEGNKRIPKGFTVKLRASEISSLATLLAQVPNDLKFNEQTPDVAYVVAKGDSLSVIARRFDTTVARLVALNQLPSQHRLAIGQRLLLPQENVREPARQAAPQLLAASTVPVRMPENGIYSVRSGDTLSLIAERFRVGESDLMRINTLTDPHRIYPGQELTLPGFDRIEGTAVIEVAVTEAPRPAPEVAAAVVLETVTEIASEPTAPEIQLALAPQREQSGDAVIESEGLDAEELALEVTEVLSVQQSNEQLIDALSTDPSDYRVAANGSIEIQASETLGHYADWLGLRAIDLRRTNRMSSSQPVVIGQRLTLDFSKVSVKAFEVNRRAFHLQQQKEFFAEYRIHNVENHKVAANDNISSIARIRYGTPMWLVRQYNPELNYKRVQIGQEIIFPLLESAN